MFPLRRGVKFSSRSWNISKFSDVAASVKPKASEVLTTYLKQTREPPWTSYFVKYMDVVNDQYGMSHFNWEVGQSNYTVLRVGCFPFIKYHCTRSPKRNLEFEDKFFRFIKVANLGIPCLLYGIAALFLIRHKELVRLESGNIYIYFLIKENLEAEVLASLCYKDAIGDSRMGTMCRTMSHLTRCSQKRSPIDKQVLLVLNERRNSWFPLNPN